jgi:hypothetical protein
MTLTMGFEHIRPQARRDMCSAVRSFAKVVGQSPGDIIADPAVVRSLTARAPWQLADYTKARWANILSNLSRIMLCCDINVDRQRRNYSVSPEWKALLAPLTRRDHDELRRFAGWCSVRDIAPNDVTPATFDQFLEYMLAQSMQRNPRERAHVPRRAWNRAVAVPGTVYPRIPAPKLPGHRALRWTDFPQSLQDEIDAYSAHALKISEIEDDNRPIKPVTLGNYLASIRVLLTALINGGMTACCGWPRARQLVNWMTLARRPGGVWPRSEAVNGGTAPCSRGLKERDGCRPMSSHANVSPVSGSRPFWRNTLQVVPH